MCEQDDTWHSQQEEDEEEEQEEKKNEEEGTGAGTGGGGGAGTGGGGGQTRGTNLPFLRATTLQKTAIFGVFPMFVPSLSW